MTANCARNDWLQKMSALEYLHNVTILHDRYITNPDLPLRRNFRGVKGNKLMYDF